MANRKKEVYKPKPMTEGKRNLIQGLLQEYDIETAEDIQDALKDLLSGTIQEMLEAEMDDHLGYENMNVLKNRITVMAQNPNGCEVNMVSSKWMSLRTGKALLSQRLSRNGKRYLLHRR